MNDKLRASITPHSISPFAAARRAVALLIAAAALAAAFIALQGMEPARGQSAADCDGVVLGTFSGAEDLKVTVTGRWTTQDCDSRYRIDSDAHTYRIELLEGGRIRIDLSSERADSFLYLFDEDGNRIIDNDDGGDGLNARIERDLTPGVYVVEATTVGGRSRGPADYTLTVSRVTGCEPVHLGSLETGKDLTATGSWSLDTCGSGFVVEHPAHRYVFDLPVGGNVRIDLTSENGDPVMSLISNTEGLIAANDDGGARYNSRISRYLQPGTYTVEATTYLERDYQPLRAEFELVIHLVDETTNQNTYLLKIEEVHTPEYVIAGQSFPVHFRVGNVGGGDLADPDKYAWLYVVGPRYAAGPRAYDYTRPIPASDERWRAGDSYHSGPHTSIPASVAIDEVKPFEATLASPGPAWLFVAVVTYQEEEDELYDQELGFHGQWHNLMVLSGEIFDEVTVSVDGAEYTVEAVADEEGEVTTTVVSVADAEAEVDESTRARAIYAAGVRTQTLDGLFWRPGIAAIPKSDSEAAVAAPGPSSEQLLGALASRYAAAYVSSAPAASLGSGEVVIPSQLEAIVLSEGDDAAAQFATLRDQWTTLQGRVSRGQPLSFEDASALQSQLAYAERVLSPLAVAGEAVKEAQQAGWQSAAAQSLMGNLAGSAACGSGAESLSDALGSDVSELDSELRPSCRSTAWR